MERRRVYDIINIYQSLGIVKKVARKIYEWCGLTQFCEKLDEAMSGNQSSLRETQFGNRPFEELTMNFLEFMSQRVASTTLEGAAEVMSKNSSRTVHINFKTKVRRLYDITNVLMSLGVVSKVRRNNRQEFEWIGQSGLEVKFGPLPEMSCQRKKERSPSFFKEILIAS